MTWAICSHRSLKKREWANPLFFKLTKKCTKRYDFSQICFSALLIFCEQKSKWAIAQKMSDSLICSFIMSDLSKLLTVPHLSWATWAICSQYCNSFVLSNLSESLTVAHFSIATWAICSQALNCSERSEWINHSCSFDLSNLSEWANEQWAMNKWAMSEWTNEQWANEQIPNPAFLVILYSVQYIC